MTDKEKAEEYVNALLDKDDTELDKFLDENLGDLQLNIKQAGTLLGLMKGIGVCSHLDGLAEGRKEKWHDLRKNPNDLPKCSENVQIVFYIKEYFKSIEKYKNHYCLGFFKKSFLNDDVKVFIERSKGYECEHSSEEILYWCELPEFKE